MSIDLRRLIKDFEYVSQFTSTKNNGCTRLPFSYEAERVKEYIISEMTKLNINSYTDSVGNVRVYMKGKNSQLPHIVVGSHIDSVFNGGNYDGICGVLCALEVFRVLKEKEKLLNRDIELVGFDGEEGCFYPSPYIGSKLITGKLSIDDIKNLNNLDEISYYNAAKNRGYNPENITSTLLYENNIKATIELHVEQGNLLDSIQVPIGIVKDIKGFYRTNIKLIGESRHSGATPMYLRKDPMLSAGKIMMDLHNWQGENASKEGTITFGRINCIPNYVNAVPEQVELTVEYRDISQENINSFKEFLKEKVKEVSYKYNVEYEIDCIGESKAIKINDNIVNIIKKASSEEGIEYKLMSSGAGHDICSFEGLSEIGMIFIPSRNGISHNMDEYTDWEDIEKGCMVLMKTLTTIANE